ncbi:MAG: 1-acyl-sn-glycerol-3-phosphate acyltransferase [Tepidanaerobacteraceae bacterium]|nr:1-acyl-sn-glycerol-3-phosphate acyltransferase [Tepidanaerobacteraceae bacterium]
MLYSIAKFLCTIAISVLFKIRTTGMEHFPEKGPVIVYSNHRSMWDPVIIGCILKRPVYFMAKEELFKIPILGFILKNINAFPVKRGSADRNAIKRCIQVLKENKVLGIFPEGTRSRTGVLLDPEPGIAMIYTKCKNAVMVPVAIKGNYRWFSRVEVAIGKPIDIEITEDAINSRKLKEISITIFKEVSKLMSI